MPTYGGSYSKGKELVVFNTSLDEDEDAFYKINCPLSFSLCSKQLDNVPITSEWTEEFSFKIESGDIPSKYHNVALVVGVTGISGNSLADILQLSTIPGGRWKVYGVGRRRQPEWQFHHNHVQYIQCNMVDPEDCQAKLSHLSDVTHIFYVGWVTKPTEQESSDENGKMLRNVLNAVIPNAPNLKHICLQTGQKYALPCLDSSAEIQHEPQFVEEFPREDITDSYYAMEDILDEEVQKKEKLTWSVHRPAVMFGFSPYSTRNIVGSLCVYATICKHEGQPLRFPGNQAAWDGYSEAGDADLVAEQQIWASLDNKGKKQAFNCSNGDLFKWKDLWKVLAEEFEVKFLEFEEESNSLEEMMREKGPVWDEIVQEKDLLPTKLEEVGTWWYVDSILRSSEAVLDSNNISRGMEKSRNYGFGGSRETAESFRFWIEHTRRYKIIP
ncbi:(S)-8-oxocitronellyl enol synthase ISY1-like [Spinacia oleracea]|uniref:(S)-8-oxocitronellyl enol synthase ISY1-like n=1 Tax=Spinacia oleracea TaxID=3562 RepID=A0ABM3R949_SPIOL|nr:(S)-8-oxocitronellyl enol synthase ISY1-like [Spinacia oleracea]